MKTDDLIQLFKWKMLSRMNYVDAMKVRGIMPVIKRGDCEEDSGDELKQRHELESLKERKIAVQERKRKELIRKEELSQKKETE